MVFYILVFVFIGILLGLFCSSDGVVTGIVIFSGLWIFVFGPWALAAFLELAIGAWIGRKIRGVF